jgi:hypothetical protein
MDLVRAAVLASTFVASIAFAQTANPADGNYEVTIAYPSRPVVAELVLNGDSGTFRSHFGGNSRSNKCGGHDTPVTVRSATADEMKLTLEYSKVLPGCNDVNFTARRTEGETFKGRWPDPQNTIEATVVKKK